jgi:hypothetical protein
MVGFYLAMIKIEIRSKSLSRAIVEFPAGPVSELGNAA